MFNLARYILINLLEGSALRLTNIIKPKTLSFVIIYLKRLFAVFWVTAKMVLPMCALGCFRVIRALVLYLCQNFIGVLEMLVLYAE